MIWWSGGLSWGRGHLSRRLSLAGKAAYVGGMLIATACLALPMQAEPLASVSLLGGWGLGLGLVVASLAVWLTRGWTPGPIELTPSGVVVRRGSERPRSFPTREIRSAYVVQRPVGAGFVDTVEIGLGSGDLLTVRLSDATSGHALVEELGFGQGGKSVTFELATPARRLLHAPLACGAYMIASVISFFVLVLTERVLRDMSVVVAPLTTLAVYQLLKLAVRPMQVSVGDDGVLLRSAFGRRFLPRAAIASISQIHPSVALVIHTRDGRRERVAGVLTDVHRRVSLGRALSARLTGGAPPDRVPLFERGGRAVGEWRTHLAQMIEDGSYRTAGASLYDAAAVVASPHASAEQRVGAALALRVAGEPERIRVAAESALDVRLREALDAAAAGDDERVERALRRSG